MNRMSWTPNLEWEGTLNGGMFCTVALFYAEQRVETPTMNTMQGARYAFQAWASKDFEEVEISLVEGGTILSKKTFSKHELPSSGEQLTQQLPKFGYYSNLHQDLAARFVQAFDSWLSKLKAP